MRLLIAFISLLSIAYAQFNIFEQVFGGGGQHAQQHHQQQNNPSDAAHFRTRYLSAMCDKYLCPDTLACVHFPHHCPCAWDAQQDKFEFAEGHRMCVSKGGYKDGEAARKIELARKGLL